MVKSTQQCATHDRLEAAQPLQGGWRFRTIKTWRKERGKDRPEAYDDTVVTVTQDYPSKVIVVHNIPNLVEGRDRRRSPENGNRHPWGTTVVAVHNCPCHHCSLSSPLFIFKALAGTFHFSFNFIFLFFSPIRGISSGYIPYPRRDIFSGLCQPIHRLSVTQTSDRIKRILSRVIFGPPIKYHVTD